MFRKIYNDLTNRLNAKVFEMVINEIEKEHFPKYDRTPTKDELETQMVFEVDTSKLASIQKQIDELYNVDQYPEMYI